MIEPEPHPPPGGDEDGPDAHGYAGAATAFFVARFFGAAFVARTPSSHSWHSSSSMLFAYISSEARIFFAFTNICFSPVESPFSWSRSARLRTTSASSITSPVFILSRLCLKRRFQFFGISVELPVSALRTIATSFSPITVRRPTFSAFSQGTCTVMSLCRILIVRYSRFSPRTSRDSFLTIVPAPWCGYTTLSPILYDKPDPPLPCVAVSAKRAGARRHRPRTHQNIKNRLETRRFKRSAPRLKLQIAVNEVVLLEPPQPLADLPGPHRTDTFDRLEIPLRGPDDRVERLEMGDDLAHRRLRQARDVGEDAVPARLHRVVQ